MAKRHKRTIEEAADWLRTVAVHDGECLLADTGVRGVSLNDAGYAMVRADGRKMRGHRVVAEAAGLEVGGAEVLQTCGNRRCINVEHLELRPARVSRTIEEAAEWLLAEAVHDGECLLANPDVRGVQLEYLGYVRVCVEGRKMFGHRVVAEAMQGPLVDPDDGDLPVDVHHSCGRRDCVSPSHLVIADGRSNGLESRRFAALEHAWSERYANLEQHLVDTHEERDAWRRRAEVAEAALDEWRFEAWRRRVETAEAALDEWRERAVELGVQVAEEHELRLAAEEELARARGEAARLYERLERPADPPSPDLFRVDL